ncbi:MAG: PaaI family thioesterase [Burkholderiaceae bacterium]|nr:PaaI family thioesterase [Burkholderiaceae bacterium]
MQNLSLPVMNAGLFEEVANWFCGLPHCRTIGLEFVNGERGRATMRVPYNTALVGNPRSGVLHGGVITSLIDTCSATAVAAHLEDFETIATLDLRIDYLKPATPGRTIYCTAECYRFASQIAFTRAVCYHDSIDDPIAHGIATFMRGSSSTPMLPEGAS